MGWWLQVVANEFKKLFIYKVLFWVDFFVSTFSHVLIAYFLWQAIFDSQGVSEIKGYTLPGLVFYYLAVNLVERINLGAGWKAGAMMDIYEGGLTKYIVYPLSYFRFKGATHAAYYVINSVKALFGMVLFLSIFGKPAEIVFSVESIFYALVLTMLSAYLQFLSSFIIDSVAFWADNVWSLQVMFKFLSPLLGGGLIPIVMFPEEWRRIVEWLPFMNLFSYPVNAILGKMDLNLFLQALCSGLLWVLVSSLVLNFVWKKGMREYTGVGV